MDLQQEIGKLELRLTNRVSELERLVANQTKAEEGTIIAFDKRIRELEEARKVQRRLNAKFELGKTKEEEAQESFFERIFGK
jgi:hypothetical protein